jgi:curli production assembly/transport component CsgG
MKTAFNLSTARALAAVAGLCVMAGCQSVDSGLNPGLVPPALAPITVQNDNLRVLPPPTKRVVVAVYDFPDMTGQFKDSTNVQTLSKAVTQGGAPMLIKALQDAGERQWFTILDRARLDDLLKERQILTEMRRLYRNEEKVSASVLPPLRHAGIILEGGIIGYDTNTLTGGLGARYLGIGADGKWQQDTVTVTLRAVSTDTGEVLATTSVHKAVGSYAVSGGTFRYVALDKILEAEAGVTQNEPKQIAVQQSIEKAVKSLIIEGAELGIWSFRDAAAGRQIIADYKKEKYGTKITPAAMSPLPPDTKNPTKAVETVELVAQRPRAQPAAAPAAPPAAAKNETVGSIVPARPGPADYAVPPVASKNEVVGSSAPASADEAPVSAIAVALN